MSESRIKKLIEQVKNQEIHGILFKLWRDCSSPAITLTPLSIERVIDYILDLEKK